MTYRSYREEDGEEGKVHASKMIRMKPLKEGEIIYLSNQNEDLAEYKDLVDFVIGLWIECEPCKRMMFEFGYGLEHCEEVVRKMFDIGLLQFRIDSEGSAVRVRVRGYNIIKCEYEYLE